MTHPRRPVKLSCRNLWKVFGANAEAFLRERGGKATSAELAKASLAGAVRSAAIDVHEGEIFIVMGLSGSGKSTLVRCLSRLIEPTFGEVTLDGRDLLKASEAELIEIRRRKMGMVFQHFALLPHLTVLENVAFPLSVQGVEKAQRMKRAMAMIDLVGLKEKEHQYPRQLSGGQQQRVGIARSLAVEPEIWFLDEPFSALDPLIRREMQSELMRLQGVLKKTIVFITHDFDEAIRLADRIAIMKDGEIIQIGTPEDLVLKPATDYVAEFTRDVNRAKVMSAQSLMQPAKPSAKHDGRVAARAKIASFAPQIVSAKKPFAVVGDDGDTLGEVTPEAVIDLLAGREQAGAAAVTDIALAGPQESPALGAPLKAAAVAIIVIGVCVAIAWIIPGAWDYPASAIIPFAEWISKFMLWIKATFTGFTRALAAIISVPLQIAMALLAKGYKFSIGDELWQMPRLSWLGICAAAAIIGHALGGIRLALVGGLGFLYIAFFRQWDSAMLTLALILVCVPICVVTGLLIGILGHLFPTLNRLVISPALDLLQTIPTFAYLIPMLLLFGNSPVSALLATGLFAMPPMVRATMLGLAKVPQEIRDFADMAGCTFRQKLWRVLVPSAKPSLMIGVNQVIMLALNMVIISSMIGAGGLGYDVLLALRALKVGQAMEAGIAIVVLAIVLDRLSQAAATRKPDEQSFAHLPLVQRYPHAALALAILIATTLLGLVIPALNDIPDSWTITTAPAWKAAVDWVTLNFFDTIEYLRTGFLIYVLNPLRNFFENLPWFGVVLVLAVAGYRFGAFWLALVVALLTAFCAVTGLWVQTMATLYLCGASAFVSAALGIPIGLAASRSDRIEKIVTPIIDTLQTIPSFCFIIPVVMLFRVGDVTALIATVAFAIVPAIRYTNYGIRQVPHELIEAGIASGCTKGQLFRRVQLPIALPEIMLGLNQTILLALSMIVICAMIGTRDLGQEVFKALSKADSGKGLVAGLCIAFIGIVADRLITAWVNRIKAKRGLA